MPSGCRDQVAVVTGASTGLGQAFATALAAAGAHVVAVARRADRLLETVTTIREAGGRAIPVVADVTSRAAVDRCISLAVREFGAVHLLVNNAGVGPPIGPLVDVEPDDWWHTAEVNLRGPMLCTRAVLGGMYAQRQGRIINVASGAGTVAVPYLSAYSVTKTALIRFSETIAIEAHPFGVSVFAIEPGTVLTDMARTALDSEAGRRWMPWFGRAFDEQRDVSAAYSAELVCWLAAGHGDGLTGRFISRADDLDALARDADAIAKHDSLVLRLRRGVQVDAAP